MTAPEGVATMNSSEDSFKNESKLEDKIDYLIQEVNNLKNRQQEILDRLEQTDVEEVARKNQKWAKLFQPDGSPKNKDVAKVLKKSKSGQGVSVGEVEKILDYSRRHTLKLMRLIGQRKDNYKFVRGKGNKPSLLKNTNPVRPSEFED